MKIYNDFDEAAVNLVLGASSSFKTIEPYNEQYQNTEKDDPKGYPALYIELLEPITWRQAGNAYQTADVRTRLHVVHFSLKTDKQGIHAHGQEAFELFNQKKLFDTDGNEMTTEWVRVGSSLPKRYRQLKVLTIDFEFGLFDRSGVFNWGQANVTFNIPTGQ